MIKKIYFKEGMSEERHEEISNKIEYSNDITIESDVYETEEEEIIGNIILRVDSNIISAEEMEEYIKHESVILDDIMREEARNSIIDLDQDTYGIKWWFYNVNEVNGKTIVRLPFEKEIK